MTIIAKRFCSHPGCNTLVDSGPCQRHKVAQMERKDTKAEQERKFYSSTAWRKLSEAHRRDEPLCRECAKQGKVVAATCTDHIKPIRENGDPYDSDGLQSLCDRCHGIKRVREKRPHIDSIVRKLRAEGRA